MRAILVIGSIHSEEPGKTEQFQQLSHALGVAVIQAGHRLLNGGRDDPTTADKHVAAGAARACEEKALNPKERILAVVREENRPHGIGRLENVRGEVDVEKRLSLVQRSDAVIVLGGARGTKEYLVLAELSRKPIIPVPLCGGTAVEYFERYRRTLGRYFPPWVGEDDLDSLNQMVTSPDVLADIARAAVNLTKKSLSESNSIFVAMPFTGRYNNTLRAIKRAVEKVNAELDEVQYVCKRVDEVVGPGRLDEEIEKQITNATIVVADVSERSSNVYYEVGFARGKDIRVIPIAVQGSELDFDIRTLKTEFYNLKADDLDELQKLIEDFADSLKKTIMAAPRRQ